MDIPEALKKFEFMRNNGVPLFDISRELGISMATLRRWEADRKRSDSQNVSLRGHNGDVTLSVHVNVWSDIGLVLGRLSVGVVLCTLLFKAVSYLKAAAIMLAGFAH